MAVPPLACSRSIAQDASERVRSLATASWPGAGKSCWAVPTPAISAKCTPSSRQATAALAACRAAAMRPSACIEPDASTMMISVVPDAADRGAPPPPDEVTVTIALTSVAPRARNSFWKASAVYDILAPMTATKTRGRRGSGRR